MRRIRRPAARSTVAIAMVSLALGFVQSSAASVAVGPAARATTSSVALPAATPGWPQLNYGPDRIGYQPNETLVGTGNVGTLKQGRVYLAGTGGMSAPLIVNGVLYTDAAGYLVAFDATGTIGCSAAPSSCTPLWKAQTAYFDGMAVSNGEVFVSDAEGVQAFDANGMTNCSGTPKVCAPLWATSRTSSPSPFTPGSGSPLVSNGVLYVPGYGDGLAVGAGGAYVAAFDAAGSINCSGGPKLCTPMWTTIGVPSSVGNSGSPAVSNGVLYLADGTLFAFSAAGVTGCSGVPKVCDPLWTSPSITGPTYSAPAVSNGSVYVTSWYSGLYAFDAAGSTNCTTTASVKTCTPLWTAPTAGGIGGTPAVAYGRVYTVSGSGLLSAFDASGSKNCSGTVTAKTCTPLWASGLGGSGYVTSSSPAVANGVVYFSSTDGGTYAYDAAGSLNCVASGTTRTCTPLWGAVTGFIGGGSPAVVSGVVYINLTAIGAIYAYGAPPAAPTGVKAVSGSTTTTTGSLTVTFIIGANNGSAITSQTATCTSSNGGVTRTGTHSGSTAAAITVASLTTGKTYTCKVTATNARGTSLASAPSLPVTVGAPAAPTGVKAVSGSTTTATGSLTVSFIIGANNGSAITSQTATCTSSNGGVTKTGTHTGATAAPITVALVTTAKTYTCTVKAINADGASLASAPSLPVTVGAPAAPTGVQAVRVATGQLKVTFTPGANNGSAITSQTATCTSSNGGVTGATSGAASPLTVTGLTASKTYICTVTATNARGTSLTSTPSATVTA